MGVRLTCDNPLCSRGPDGGPSEADAVSAKGEVAPPPGWAVRPNDGKVQAACCRDCAQAVGRIFG